MPESEKPTMKDRETPMSRHILPRDPNYRNLLMEPALLALIRSHRTGGKAALRKQFAKLYPDKVSLLPPAETDQEPTV
jgi:hypothetical protein